MHKITIALFTFSLIVTPLNNVHALSCIQESFSESMERTAIVAEVTPIQLINTDRSSSIASEFTWEVEVQTLYKGEAVNTLTLTDVVWPGMADTQSRLQADQSYLVFLSSDAQMGMCDYPRELNQRPLTTDELKELGNGTSTETAECAPYECKSGKTFSKCTEDGVRINYLASPCNAYGGEVGEPITVQYNDVDNNTQYANAISWATEQGLTSGYNDGSFKPTNTINRAEFLKVLLEPVGAVCRALYPYSDVDFTAWYGDYVQSASCMGLVKGNPDGSFRPGSSINAAEAAKIIVTQHSAGRVQQSTTTDWYTPFINYLQIRNALPISITFADQAITRAEMVEMLYQLELYTELE
jgi:hypothetical protein